MRRLRQLLVIMVVVTVGATAVIAQSSETRVGTGHQLIEDCALYFAFLGRTGAGRQETYDEDPFGMGYCAGVVRGVANSADAFHPEINCRLNDFSFHAAVRAVVRYLDTRPQALDEQDTVLILRALQLADICSAVAP